MLQRYTDWLIKNHKWILVLAVVSTLLLATGVHRLSFTNDFRIYFSEDNPQLEALEKMETIFGKQEAVYFFITTQSGDLFSRQHLALIHELTEAAWNLPHVSRVNSLTNYQHTEARGDELTTDYLLRDRTALSAEKIAWIKQVALNEPTLVNHLISADGKATGVIARLRLPEQNQKAPDEAVHAARSLLQALRDKYPQANISLGGATTAGVVLGEAVARDMGSLVSLSYSILIIGLLLLLRSLRGMLVTVVLMSFSIAATMGIYGWFGAVLTPVAGWVPSVVMTIAVADSVHMLISYFHSLRQGMAREEAIRESLRINLNPVFVTSLTTIIGVLCLNFSDSPPYRDLGNMVALGVLYAWLLSMTFLPAVLAWLSVGRAYRQGIPSKRMDAFANFVIRRRRWLLVGMGLWVVLAASFIPANELTER